MIAQPFREEVSDVMHMTTGAHITAYADQRIAIGGPLAGNILKCQLKPIDNKDYTQPLSAGELTRISAVFPQGVCDYSKPGIGQQMPTGPWQKY